MSVLLPSTPDLPDIVSLIISGDYERAVALLQPYAAAKPKQQRSESSSSTLVVLYLYASLQCKQYSNLQEWAELQTPSSSKDAVDQYFHVPHFLVAYAHYQLKQYSKVISLYKQQQQSPSGDSRLFTAWEHLYAQALYHLHSSDRPRVVQVYDTLLQQESISMEYRIYTWTNLLAVLLAYYNVPYCTYMDWKEGTRPPHSVVDSENVPDDPIVRVQSLIQTHVSTIMECVRSNEDVSPDLVYNLSSYLLPGMTRQEQRRFWMERLHRSMGLIHISKEEEEKEEELPHQFIKDVILVHMNHTLYDRFFWNASYRRNASNSASSGFNIFNHLSWTIRDAVNNSRARKDSLPDDDAALLAILPQQARWVYRINQLLLNPSNNIEAMIDLLKNEILSNEDHRQVLTNAQLHILHYTLALYYLYDQQHMACQEMCQQYFLSATTSKSKKKKQAASSATPSAFYSSTAEQWFWECRATVLLAHCDVAADRKEDRVAALDRFGQGPTPPGSLNRSVEEHVQVYARVHQMALLAKDEAAPNGSSSGVAEYNMLQSLPASIQSKPAIVSALRRVRPSSNDGLDTTSQKQQSEDFPEPDFPTRPKLTELMTQFPDGHVLNVDASWEVVQQWIVYGDYAMSQTIYADAATLYAAALSVLKRRPATFPKAQKRDADQYLQSVTAKYVCALSHVQPAQAIALWSTLSIPPLQNESLLAGAELERKEIASIASSSIATVAPVKEAVTKEKRRAARLRRRARQRELYVQSLPSSRSAPHPDRWRPRYERGQGAGATDAGALDVVARQAHRGDAKSTAHMHVSGGGKGGGKKKRR